MNSDPVILLRSRVEDSEIHHAASMETMTEGNIIQSKWQLVAASVIGLTGAFFGGVYGSLLAAFTGDSWWTNDIALGFFQFALAFGGVCLGAVPGAIWLLCLRQRWVLPILWAAAAALLLPALESMRISNEPKGLLYGGIVISGLVIGFSIWACGRRSSRNRNKASI
jgi:hypothetical protein